MTTSQNVSIEHIQRTCSGKHVTVAMAQRPFAMLYAMLLEYRHYDPKDEVRNAAYEFFIVPWEDIMWLVVATPLNERSLSEECLKETHLRLADGVPTILPGPKFFPVAGPHVFTIETDWDNCPWKTSEMTAMYTEEKRRMDDVRLTWMSGGRP